MPRLQRTKRAERDLISIGRDIEGDNPDAADRLLQTFQQKFELLAQFPLSGQKRNDLAPRVAQFPRG